MGKLTTQEYQIAKVIKYFYQAWYSLMNAVFKDEFNDSELVN